MLGDPHRLNPTVHVPPSPTLFDDDPTTDIFSPFPPSASNAGPDYSPYYMQEALAALHRYLPSADADSDHEQDAYSCDHFRMFDFKVRKCVRGRSHDWTDCPYAHPGEKARRRDPRKYHYSGTACPDFRKGGCKKGDACEYAHGVFECWLHPARYRTQPCKDGISCRRKVCFFAHTPEQLRLLPQHSPRSVDSYDGSPLRKAIPFLSSPRSVSPPVSPPAESPPMSPVTRSLGRSLGSGPVNVSEMMVSLRNMQLGKVNSLPSSWKVAVGSPRVPAVRPGFCSLPSTPTEAPGRGWDQIGCEEEPVMERVESGRDIRAKMLEKLRKENSLGSSGGAPDFGWVSELFK